MSASQTRLYAVQHRLDAAAGHLLAAGGAGSASIIVVPQRSELRVYWHGRVPAEVSKYAARLGVRVLFLPAAFTLRALVAYERRLITDPGVVQVSPRPDGSGLDVMVRHGDPGREAAQLRATSQIPLTVTTGEPIQPMDGRLADTPPFSGGSFYVNMTTNHSCSNGFAMKVEGLVPPLEISAGHCGTAGTKIYIPGHAAPTGEIEDKATCRDVLQINYGGKPGVGRIQGRIYTGGPTSTTSIPVSGASPDYVGDTVNTDGASSGEHVGIKVARVDASAKVDGIGCVVRPLTEAKPEHAGMCVDAHGDSGGPVFSPVNQKSADARGTIVGGTGDVQCPKATGHQLGDDTVYYAPLLRPAGDPQIGTLQYYLGSILTAP